MRVVIPVANEERNRSLAYALASIRKHTDLDPVTVGGRDFGLCDHIDTGEGRSNAYSKFNGEATAMRTAIHTIGETFVWSNDDVYWLRPSEPIRWALGDLTADSRRSVYMQRKHATAHALRAAGLPTYDYESHTPLTITPKHMLEALDWCDSNPQLDKRSVYGNLTGLPDLIAPDVKVRTRRDPLPDAPWASSNGSPTTWPALMAALNA